MLATSKPPAYRRRIVRGTPRAVVTLQDSESRVRRDFWLGEYGSDTSRQKYARLIADWEGRGRRLPASAGPGASGTTVAELCWEFWIDSQRRYSRSHLANLRTLIRVLREMYGDTAAAQFGPNALRQVRQSMLAGDPNPPRDDFGAPLRKPRRPWSVRVSNRFARHVVQIFKWGVAHELVKPDVWTALRSLESLRADLELCRPKIVPAPLHAVEAVKPFVSRSIATMIDLQLMTGMRPGEVCVMRPCDIEIADGIWTYRTRSKTAHHGYERVIYLGPRAQAVIKPLMVSRATTAYLFSPREAEAERRDAMHAKRVTPAGQGNGPGTNRAEKPARPPRALYSRDSYGRAIRRACDVADAAARARAGSDSSIRFVPRWHPNQLRHNFATEVRKKHGLEAAAILLGHATAHVTEAVYAQRDMDKATLVAREIG